MQGQSGMILDKTHARDLGNSCEVQSGMILDKTHARYLGNSCEDQSGHDS